MTSSWTPTSWRRKPIRQVPAYPDPARLEAFENKIRSYPPLVFAGEARRLKAQLGQVQEGKAIVLQGGDTVYVNRAPMYYIYGEAQRPGSYRIERGMTVMQALAQGGGPTARGTDQRLVIHRSGADGVVQEIKPALNDLVRNRTEEVAGLRRPSTTAP